MKLRKIYKIQWHLLR